MQKDEPSYLKKHKSNILVNSELTTIVIKLRHIHKLIKEEVEGMPNRPSVLYERD